MRKLRTLIGMPVVVQNRRIGRVVQAALSEDLTSLDGLWVDEGLRGTRLIPSESLEMLGRIAVVADLHLPHSLSSPQQVADAVQDAAPDCIFIAGDLANRYAHFDKDGIDAFLAALTAIAPCVAVIGNHERGVYRENYCAAMQKAGIPLMENRFETLERGGQTLPVYGVGYPPKTVTATDVPALLLLHHPEDAAAFKSAGFSLAVCGHAHGGQIGLGKRGLYAPGQGFFPQYVSGLYTVGDMALVVSRGLGDSSLSLRLHNPPHLPVLTLYGK